MIFSFFFLLSSFFFSQAHWMTIMYVVLHKSYRYIAIAILNSVSFQGFSWCIVGWWFHGPISASSAMLPVSACSGCPLHPQVNNCLTPVIHTTPWPHFCLYPFVTCRVRVCVYCLVCVSVCVVQSPSMCRVQTAPWWWRKGRTPCCRVSWARPSTPLTCQLPGIASRLALPTCQSPGQVPPARLSWIPSIVVFVVFNGCCCHWAYDQIVCLYYMIFCSLPFILLTSYNSLVTVCCAQGRLGEFGGPRA